MIKKEEVKRIAKLARLGLSENEEEKMTKDLSLILDYFDKLKEVDVSNVDLASQNTVIKNIKRKDNSSGPSLERSEELLKGTPNKKGRYVKVRAVFK